MLRGGGSAIYGADVMGGVINIVTRRGAAKPADVTLSGGVGGDDYYSFGARLAGSTEQVSASHISDGETSDGADLDLDTVNVSLAFHPSARADVQFFVNSTERDSSQLSRPERWDRACGDPHALASSVKSTRTRWGRT